MPRKGRGGSRSGTQGKAYSNRSDLNEQPIRTAPSTEYGSRVAQERMQRAQPLPQMPSPVPLLAPSQRPGEPVTAGLPLGAGPGPEVLPSRRGKDNTVAKLRALYQLHPSEDLRRLLARAEGTGDPDLSLNAVPGRRAWFSPRMTEDSFDFPSIPDRGAPQSFGGGDFDQPDPFGMMLGSRRETREFHEQNRTPI